jgi:hypothetical protein
MTGLIVDVVEDGVYISDDRGEIVCWVLSEVEDDPSVAFVIANALKIGYEQGPQAVRDRIDSYPQD